MRWGEPPPARNGQSVSPYPDWMEEWQRLLPMQFWVKVAPGPDDCWRWTGSTSRGYGQYWVRTRPYRTHRLTYAARHGAASIEGLEVDHLCRVPLCCNPWHGEPVSQAVNLLRKQERPPHPGLIRLTSLDIDVKL